MNAHVGDRPAEADLRGATTPAHRTAGPTVGLDLTHLADAGRRARAYVRSHAEAWLLPRDAVDVALLLTSELVANAVRHAPPPLALILTRLPGGLRVDVVDSSAAVPQEIRPDHEAEAGRGVWLLEMLATCWGYEPEPSGKRVWFVLETPPADPPATRTGDS